MAADDEFDALIRQLDNEAESARKRLADRIREIKQAIADAQQLAAIGLCDKLIADLDDGRQPS